MTVRVKQTRYDSANQYDSHLRYDGLVMAPACDPSGSLIEWDLYVTADGVAYNLHSPPIRSVVSMSGYGLGPGNFITEQGPYQHGVAWKDYFMQPRVIQMSIRQNGVSRRDYWLVRQQLQSMLKSNRTVGGGTPKTGTLIRYFPDGSSIALDCIATQGPTGPGFNPQGPWDQWSVSEVIQFTAFNPVYYNPTKHSSVFMQAVNALQFPITFPILFGAIDVTTNLVYQGEWPSYPNFVITGPITAPSIINNSTGEMIQFNVTVPSGVVMTLKLSPDPGYSSITKTCKLADGTSVLPFLVPGSALATFHLAPDPEVPGGMNTLHLIGTGSNPTTSIEIDWYDRYPAMQMTG